jgi:hypothetical protein
LNAASRVMPHARRVSRWAAVMYARSGRVVYARGDAGVCGPR